LLFETTQLLLALSQLLLSLAEFELLARILGLLSTTLLFEPSLSLLVGEAQ